MKITPLDIQQQQFRVRFRGFVLDDVRAQRGDRAVEDAERTPHPLEERRFSFVRPQAQVRVDLVVDLDARVVNGGEHGLVLRSRRRLEVVDEAFDVAQLVSRDGEVLDARHRVRGDRRRQCGDLLLLTLRVERGDEEADDDGRERERERPELRRDERH